MPTPFEIRDAVRPASSTAPSRPRTKPANTIAEWKRKPTHTSSRTPSCIQGAVVMAVTTYQESPSMRVATSSVSSTTGQAEPARAANACRVRSSEPG